MNEWLRDRLKVRPWWMNGLMIFCAYMAFFHMFYDFFLKPVDMDQEAWFGFLLRGWWAKLTEPIHWFLYAAGAYGFWRMKHWMHPWAALYAAQVAFGMFVWNAVYVGGYLGWFTAIVSLVPFGGLTLALWQAKPLFQGRRTAMRDRYGEWAVVTGASAGIGAAFARALAKEGMSLVLTARREQQLESLATELTQQYGVKTRVVAADLAAPEGADRVVDAVKDLSIAVLINNAGFGYAGCFDKQDLDRLREMVQVNCTAPMVLAHRLLPLMRERGRGAMIVSGSVSSHQPLPRHAIYSATKGFDLLFSESLWVEYRNDGVDVLVLEPGPTESEFVAVAGEIRDHGVPAADVVAVALEYLGQVPSVIPGWYNWIRAKAVRFLPRSVVAFLAERVILEQTPPDMR